MQSRFGAKAVRASGLEFLFAERRTSGYFSVKAEWRATNHRGRRPGIWTPGDMLVFDGVIGPLFVFCAVMAWSRVRFVYFADNLGADSTMTALAAASNTSAAFPRRR